MSIKFFSEIKKNYVAGGKGLSLAKMYQSNFNVPNGYVIMANIFDDFLKKYNLEEEIKVIINKCDINNEEGLRENSKEIIEIISKYNISRNIEQEIIDKYKKLNCKYVAVRSSAISEDGKNYAWAGQLETFLNVDENDLLECVKKCWSSIFSPRALFYMIKNNQISNISVAVVVQKMIQSDISGVAFSMNPTNNNLNEIVIEGVLGLGEAIVSGKVTPDIYIIDKKENKLKNKEIKKQKEKLIKINKSNKWINIEDSKIQKVPDKTILELSKIIKDIEEFYKFPIDVEWGIENNKVYILQCRPITTINSSKLLNKIINNGNWNFYVSRKFNWFVENTEIYASLEKYQKETLGFEIATQNYLCLNGDEYSLDLDFEILCNKLDTYFKKDINFFEKFAKTEMDLVEEIKKYIKYLENYEIEKLNLNELKIEFEKFNGIYIKSFISGMTRPDDYLVDKLRKELIGNKFTEKEIEFIFSKISTCPNYFPLSYSEEPLDLLNIALLSQNGENIEKVLEKHIQKYSWIKGPLEFESTAFKKKDYLLRLENLLDTNIEERINNIKKIRKNNEIEYKKILEKYKFTEKEEKLIKAIRDFIFLRTYTTEYSDHLFYIARQTIFKEISNRINMPIEDLIMLDDKEIIQILDKQGKLTNEIKDTLESRKKGFAMLWISGEVQTIFGDESLKIQGIISDIYKKSDNEEENTDKKVISGSIANTGRVIGIAKVLTKYEDVLKVEKGDIIVATMTTPDYVSAMEKAAGFITDEGGITCHAAILSREFNVPCIVGTINGTKEIRDGQKIELDAYKGKIYIIE